jgi:hypothetical protein
MNQYTRYTFEICECRERLDVQMYLQYGNLSPQSLLTETQIKADI